MIDRVELERLARTMAEALTQAAAQINEYAAGWNFQRLARRLSDIERYAHLNRNVVPLTQRRKIARCARDLLDELEGLGGGGARATTLDDLRSLAGLAPAARTDQERAARRDQEPHPRTRRGGDRRSGEHSLETSVLRLALRLFYEARAKPRFSVKGPMVRFANAAGKLAGLEKPFTSDAVKAEWRRMKLKRKRDVLTYTSTDPSGSDQTMK